MQQPSKPNSGNGSATASLLAREVAELYREKAELLEENASLKKGLGFLLGRYFSQGDCNSCRFTCRRLTFMMLDANIVATSPSSVWRVLGSRTVIDVERQAVEEGHVL